MLTQFGAEIEVGPEVRVQSQRLVSPGRVDVSGTPDLFPPVCVLAACTEGTTTLLGSPGLRFKECDRIKAMAAALQVAGIACGERGDGLVIHGGTPKAGVYNSFGDHRVHMALVGLALAASEPSTINGAWSTAISYPNFHSDLEHLVP